MADHRNGLRGRRLGSAAATLALATGTMWLAARAAPQGEGGAAADARFADLQPPQPAIALRPERVTARVGGELDCAECHARVVDEWARSAHGVAWLDEVYHEELDGRRKPESCWSCHAPQPLHGADGLAKRPQTRDGDRTHGVDCAACHLAPDGAWLGARGTETEAHATRASETLAAGSNALCATCHRTNIGPVVGVARDFEQAGMAERELSCVGCHFALVEAENGGGQVRSHALQTPRDPRFLALAFEPSLERRGGALVVRIENRAGHRVPGLIGREITFEARAVDAGGETVATAELALDARRFLPVDGERELVLEADAAAVHLTAQHLDPRALAAVPFLDVRLEP